MCRFNCATERGKRDVEQVHEEHVLEELVAADAAERALEQHVVEGDLHEHRARLSGASVARASALHNNHGASVTKLALPARSTSSSSTQRKRGVQPDLCATSLVRRL